MKKKKANTLVFTIFFFILFLSFCAMAIDGAIILTQRVKLQNATESAALAGASELNSDPNPAVSQASAVTAAKNTFTLLKYGGLENVDVNDPVDFNVSFSSARRLDLHVKMIAQPLFLAFLGVNGINLEANAHAVSEPLSVTANYAGVNWVTSNSVYLSDIIDDASDITAPIGGTIDNLASYFTTIAGYSLIEAGGGPLSLGPSGYVTIKLPSPIVDKLGYDLYIKEAGDSLEGYMVFAGLDENPDNPYNHDLPGGEIYWKNISCSGTSTELAADAHSTATGTNLSPSNQDKFYGSGSFDLADACITGTANEISMAKYIRIIDDNVEDAFIKSGAPYVHVNTYGEASTATAGADIDQVTVLNSVRLISP